MKINLRELALEGEDFSFNRETGELNNILEDLVGKNPYSIQLHLKPVGNAYELKGQLTTYLDLLCSQCAGEFKQKVEVPFHEFLVIEEPMAKGDHVARANHAHEWTSEGPEATVLESTLFNVGEHFHELIALSEPIQPSCGSACKGLETEIKRDWLSIGAGQDIKENPFKVLEKLKLRD